MKKFLPISLLIVLILFFIRFDQYFDKYLYKEYNTFVKNDITLASFFSVIANNGVFVAVGENGLVVSSKDNGTTWQKIITDTNQSLHSITRNKDTLVAVGEDGVIIRSDDYGKKWQIIKQEKVKCLLSIASHYDTFLAVGCDGDILKSDDNGKTWQKVESGTKKVLVSVANYNGIFVAVGKSGTILKSEDNGKTWQSIASTTDKNLLSIITYKDMFVAVGENGVIVKSNDNGKHWQSTVSGTNEHLFSIHLNNNSLVAVGNKGVIIKSKDNGISWQYTGSTTDKHYRSIASYSDNFVIVGLDGLIERSNDSGERWNRVNSYANMTLLSSAKNNDVVVGVGSGGTIVRSDDNGRSWQNVESGTGKILYSVAVLNGEFLIVGENIILRSNDDGKNWQSVANANSEVLRFVIAYENSFLAVGKNGSVYKSYDNGLNWQSVINFEGQSLTSIIAKNGKLVVVGEREFIAKSDDNGEKWTAIIANSNRRLNSLITYNGIFIAVGEQGTILKSDDNGSSWKSIASGTSKSLLSVIATNNGFLAVGLDGTILRGSGDGNIWEKIPFNYELSFYDILYDNQGEYILVGQNGYIAIYHENMNISMLKNEKKYIYLLKYYKEFRWTFWLFWMSFAGLTALSIYVLLAKSEQKNQSLRNDLPKTSLAEDRFGLGVIANTLATLLTSYKTKTPLTIAIDAPWGSGKSSLLKMCETTLQSYGVKSVFFNLWYHQDEENLLAALMQQMLKSLTPRFFSFENIIFRLGLIWHRILKRPDGVIWSGLLGIAVYLIWKVDMPQEYEKFLFLKPLVIIVAIFPMIKNLKSYIDENASLINELKLLFGFKNFDDHIGLRDEFQKELKLLVNLQGRVVLFLDDLDRCSDEDIFLMMRTVNFLSSIENLFIVMAIDKEKVLKILEKKFATIENNDSKIVASDYLEKIFNITLQIPKEESEFYNRYKLIDEEKTLHALENSWVFKTMKKVLTRWMGIIAIFILLLIFHVQAINSIKTLSKELNMAVSKHFKSDDTNLTKNLNNEFATMGIDSTRGNNLAKIIKAQKEIKNNAEDSDKLVVIPKNIENDYSPLYLTCAFISGVFLGLWKLFRKRKQEDKLLFQRIERIVTDKKGLTPRAKNILFNKIVFLAYIGERKLMEHYSFGRSIERSYLFFYNFIVWISLFAMLKDWRKAWSLAHGEPINKHNIDVSLDEIEAYLKSEIETLNYKEECIQLNGV